MRILIAALLLSTSAMAQTQAPPSPASYQDRLFRLAEILGGLHAIRSLCESGEDSRWRDRMQELIRLERPSQDEKNGMVEHFNLGYAQTNSKFASCTDAARGYLAALAREGEGLSRGLGETVGE